MKIDVSILFNLGLYKIICLKNNKIYIDESSNVLSRISRNSDNLENNRHDCKELQKDFNEFGKKFFKFEVFKCGIKYKNQNFRQKQELLIIKKIPQKNRYNTISIKKTFVARGVLVKKKAYPSLSQAARELNESRTNLVRKCLNSKWSDYQFIEQSSKRKYKFHKPCMCCINGIVYKSLNVAAKEFNVNHSTIRYRIESDNFPNYKSYNEID